MHSRLIVLTGKDEQEDSEAVRERVEEELIAQGFAGEGGLFASPPADWFVIGGRWSGDLTTARLDQEKLKAFWKEFEGLDLGNVGMSREAEEKKAKAIELFRRFFPDFEGEPPILRNGGDRHGFEDDAQVLDGPLLGFIRGLKSYPDHATSDDLLDGRCFVDLDDSSEVPTEEAIDKKWCVVVDFYH